MSDFLESEAEESEEEELEEGGVKPSATSSRRNIISDDDEEEEEDDEEKIREEMKDLINDEEEEEEDESGDDEERKEGKRKLDSDLDDQLEEEDYDLIEENLGIKVKRKKQKRKRIRMMSDDEGSGEEGDNAEETGRDAIATELFDGDEDMDAVSERPKDVGEVENEFGDLSAEEEESDVDDFIVDEEGQPISRKGKKKRHIIHNDRTLQQAQDIFGVDFDFDEFKQYGDDYDEEEELEEEYEDEEDESSRQRAKKTGKKRAKKSIFDVFEPSELERGHFTDIDNEIKMADNPERFQLRSLPVRPTDEGELEEEAEWIHKYAFSTQTISSQDNDQDGPFNQPFNNKGPNTVTKIREALNFMRNQQFEVPFIAFYRKEYVEPELNINDLWKVYAWDEKWSQLRTRKQNLIQLFEKMQMYQFDELFADPDKPLDANVRPLNEEDIDRARGIQTIEELNDVYQHFLLYYGRDIPKMKAALKRKKRQEEEGAGQDEEAENEEQSSEIPKQATRKTGYNMCQNAGLDDLTKKFGLTPEQFGENLRDNYQRHDVEQYPIEPLEVAKEFLCPTFPTADDVLKGSRHMVAMQIAHDPLVRFCVRATFYERAKLECHPTAKGAKEIDEAHPCYTSRYLKNKPVKDITHDQFLKLVLAEDDGLLTLTIGIDNSDDENSQTYFDEVKPLYDRDEFSRVVQEWNSQRAQALERALKNILYPQMAKELRGKLIQEAKDYVVKSCCRKLYHWLKIAPYQPDQQLDDDEDYTENSKGVRVLGISYSTHLEEPSFGALVDGEGTVSDFLRMPDIARRRNQWRPENNEGKDKDLEKVKEFIATKKPHVIALSGIDRNAVMLSQDLTKIITELEQEQQIPPISVELVDSELSVIYANSKKAEHDFRDYPPLLRQAVSVARRVQDPLIEYAQMCNHDEDLLNLRFHTLQDQVNKDDLLHALQLEFVNRVNEVGVDVNRCITNSHTAPLAQFICGLGPRKASSLLKTLRQNNGRLENRAQLVTMCHMGPKVFINCAGFIRIDTNSLGDSTEAYVEVLDGSRVHPETYEWARKMAVDALEYDDTAEDANPAGALEEILESPERLKDLDLDAFAEELERQGYGNKHITLYDIRAELNHRYKDLRTTYRTTTPEEKFNMLTKETPHSFYIGKMVMCRVFSIATKRPRGEQLDQANPVRDEDTGLWQCPFCKKNDFPEMNEVWSHFDGNNCPGQSVGVKVRLDNGVNGFIPTKMISDKHVNNPEERVQIGMTLHARITKIDIERFEVELTCRSSDLSDKDNKWRLQRDLYFDYDSEDKDIQKEEEKKKHQARQTYIKRVIVHPSFHNISYKDCEKLMSTMDQGEVIVRPSSKGSDHLTCTWKVADNIYQHIDVIEEGKENAFSLGHTLLINGEEFEDLDEIIARHIQPMASYAREITNYRYFRMADAGNKEILDKMLKDEKRKFPTKIPYYFSPTKSYPGKFYLSYMPRIKARHEFVSITSNGLKYRNHMFHSINSLVRWFKEHFRDPIPGALSTPAAARTPMIIGTPSLQVDPATIQRAAAGLPSNIFNSLAQVAGATPSMQPGYTNMPYQMATPVMTPMMTPSYHTNTGQNMPPSATPNQGPSAAMLTPQYQPTPRSNWVQPTTPRTPAVQQQQQQQTPSLQQTMQQIHQKQQQMQAQAHITKRQTKGPNTAAIDWAKEAELWAKKNATKSPRTTQSPRLRADGSPIGGGGGETPLFDER
ncbi:transcription elongation factor SPT6-like [Tubulanus polymorphus]|uniref:transcription elongation factor SPT6-like n=1 Tax=Tubulanus polymorphus TaxID=672921 RepID=UPI003DA5F4A9